MSSFWLQDHKSLMRVFHVSRLSQISQLNHHVLVPSGFSLFWPSRTRYFKNRTTPSKCPLFDSLTSKSKIEWSPPHVLRLSQIYNTNEDVLAPCGLSGLSFSRPSLDSIFKSRSCILDGFSNQISSNSIWGFTYSFFLAQQLRNLENNGQSRDVLCLWLK